MSDVKVTGPGGLRGVDRAKGVRKAGQAEPTGGVSFADMLDQASEVEATEHIATPMPTAPYVPLGDEPSTAHEQANNLLESLTTLADDALAGNPTRALADLQAALQQNPIDKSQLNQPQQQALDELATRAAVEVAKRGG